MAWQFDPTPYDTESFVGLLSDAVDNMYPDPKDRLAEMRLLYKFFEYRDGSIAGTLWRNIQRRCRELRLCEFCGAAEVYIDGERYCTKCDAAEVKQLLRAKEQRAREAV